MPDKGHSVTEINIIIVGDGPHKEHLWELIQEKGSDYKNTGLGCRFQISIEDNDGNPAYSIEFFAEAVVKDGSVMTVTGTVTFNQTIHILGECSPEAPMTFELEFNQETYRGMLTIKLSK